MPRWLAAAVVLSGASALAFEVVLQRGLVLTFGAASRAAAATLAAYMAGLMLGGPLGGRLARHARSPAARYAAVECAAAVLFLTSLLAQPFARSLYATLGAVESSFGLGAVRLGLAMLTLLPATILGAASLPLIVAALPGGDETRPARAASLVAWNVLGATVGAALAAFAGIRLLGMQGTAFGAAGLGLAAAACALRPKLPPREPSAAAAPSREGSAGVLAAAAASGFVTLSLQVILLRVVLVYTTAGVYAFGLVLVAALGGLALGGRLAARRLERDPGGGARTLSVAVRAGGATGLAAVLLAPAFARLVVGDPSSLFEASAFGLFARELGLALVLLLPAFLVQGFAFPSAVAALGGRAYPTGRLLFVNLGGAALGALVTGFVTLPLVGMKGAAVATALVGVAGGASGARRGRLLLLGAACLVGAFVPIRHLKEPVGDPVVFYREGSDAVVTVREGAAGRVLRVDGQTVASSYGGGTTDARMLGHLPLLLHPAPRRALTVGFGSGGTSRAMTLHGVATDCVEIEPAVVDAAPLFVDVHRDVLVEPRLRILFEDARDHLLRTQLRYDAIASDCTNLQWGHNGMLYSREYWVLVRRRLAPRGIAVAWMPLGGLGREDLRTLLATFADVFPHATVHYFTNAVTNFFLLVGTPSRLAVDVDRIAERMAEPAVAADLASVGLSDPYRVATSVLVGESGLARLSRGAPLHTDDLPRLDYRTPYLLFRPTAGPRLRDLLAVSASADPHVVGGEASALSRHLAARRLLAEGNARLLSHRVGPARRAYRRAAALLPDDPAIPVLLEEAGLPRP